MRKEIVCILICTLLIGAATVAVADWEEGEDYKMHYPQLPDPYGVDVDWGWWSLGDDWQCIETGFVDDIHFWISWFYDDPFPIPWIDISIWSNNPQGPSGWSEPEEMLWERTFQEGEFILAGPWDGDQLWMMPWGEIIPQPHHFYWQINIKEIDDPFEQKEGEIYWLVIRMPFEQEYMVGWKNTQNYFMDHAVWSQEPGYEWIMIDGIDFAFVITGGPHEECCLKIASVTGGYLDTPKSKTVNALIANIGTGPCYNVSWSFTFAGGLIFSGPNSGVIPVIPAGGSASVSSKTVIGLALPFFLPGTVTVTVNCPNNVCGPQTVTKNVVVFILLFKLT